MVGGHFEKAVFSRQNDRFIWQYWVHCARCTLQDNDCQGTEKTEVICKGDPAKG